MKFLFLILFISLNSYANEDYKSASEIYEINKEVMNKKEIQMNPEICKWQNELAEVSNKEKYDCIEHRFHLNDTVRGEKIVNETLREAKEKSSVMHDPEKYLQMIEARKDLDHLINKLEY